MNPNMGELIYESERKGTKVYCNDRCLTKTIKKDSLHYKFFKKELEYYQMFSGIVAPRLLESSELRFSTEFLQGGVLKDYIKCIPENEYLGLLIKVLNKIEGFNSPKPFTQKSIKNNFLIFSKAYVTKVNILLLSGPKNTESSVKENNLNKLLSVFLRPISLMVGALAYITFKHSNSKLFGNRYHGDLHLNNIVLDEDEDVYLIDFENVEEFSGKLLDIIFFYSILASDLNLNTRRKLANYIFIEFKLTFVERAVWSLCVFIMRFSKKRNSRFN